MKKSSLVHPFIQASLIGFLLLVPLIVLELVNRWQFNETFPMSMFVFTWVLQTLFVFLSIPIVQELLARKSILKKPIHLFMRVLIMTLIAYIWTAWLVDQWPCLMGVPNCD